MEQSVDASCMLHMNTFESDFMFALDVTLVDAWMKVSFIFSLRT